MRVKTKQGQINVGNILMGGFLTGIILAFIVAFFLYGIYKTYKAMKAPRRFSAVAPVPPQEGTTLFVASSLDRIFSDGMTLKEPAFSTEVSLAQAKNEYESFQVVVQTTNTALKKVWFEVSDLIDPASGARIDHGNILWRVVGYVPTKQPYYPVKFVGNWPDPLLPAQPIDVDAPKTQPFWFTIYVPQNAQAGRYQAKIWMKAEGLSTPREIPVSLKVFNFELPKQNTLKTAFDFYEGQTYKRYPQKENESNEAYQARIGALNDKFLILMLQYRMNPILNVDPTSPSDLARVDRYRWFGLNNFSIGKKGGTFNNNWPATDEEIEALRPVYQGYGEMLKFNKLLPYNYIYTWDEGNVGNPRVAKICSMIHRAYPKLKNMVCYHGFWDPAAQPDWGKDIDIWCFNIDNFVESQMRRIQQAGKEMWMYISGPSGFSTPNLAIDFDSIDYRIIPWLCWKYDIRGFLYWCVNWWPFVDPFQSAANTQWEQNGNGLLFYPGPEGPIASLRAELFRDGMEDYEYTQILLQNLWAFEDLSPAFGYSALVKEIKGILTMDDSLIKSMFEYTRDGRILFKRRQAIAEKIEETDKILRDLAGKKTKISATGAE